MEIRLTPYDGEPLQDADYAMVIPFFDKLVLFEERSDTDKLHYHGYLESAYAHCKVREMLRKICHCNDNGVNGNALFFTRKPHSHTFGYISKSGKCVLRHGESQTTIDEWINASAEYVKSKSRNKKREQRTRQDELQSIIEQVEKDLRVDSRIRYVEGIIERICAICTQESVRFPTRPQMDQFVVKLMYPYNNDVVRSYYGRSFCGV